MKNLVVAAALVSTFMASTSHGLVRLVGTCQTTDNLYRVTIMDNQGIGPVRTSNLGAVVYNAKNEILASYTVISNANQISSTSFGQMEFVDKQTQGKLFLLTLGRHVTLKVAIKGGAKISELDPVCQMN